MTLADIDRAMMRRCVALSRSGADAGEYPFGSVLARGEHVIAEATNRVAREHDESRHAEILVIARARRALGDANLARCTLYSTAEPCAMCAFCIRAAGIGRVVFALNSPFMGGLTHWNILEDAALSHRLPFLFGPPPTTACGVLADEALAAWNEWLPFAPQAIKFFGFFVKPHAANAGSPHP